mmetsp:Transcript_44724/g.106140  ORF Transcript_44724/g.106140 Transcript_44724/m.106140 type:complete len:356 (+) Transcript_44724:80-1147(+)
MTTAGFLTPVPCVQLGLDAFRAHLASAAKMQKQGDLSNAFIKASEAIAFCPEAAASAYVVMADIKRLEGDVASAKKFSGKAIQIDERDPRPYGIRAAVKYLAQDLKGALNDANKALAMDTSERRIAALAYAVRASVAMAWNDFERCISDASKALDLDPNCWQTLLLRACVKQKQEDYQGSLADATKVVALNHRCAEAFEVLAEVKFTMKDLEGAKAAASHVIALQPSSADMLDFRAVIKRDLGHMADAELDAKKAHRLRSTPTPPENQAVSLDARDVIVNQTPEGMELIRTEARHEPVDFMEDCIALPHAASWPSFEMPTSFSTIAAFNLAAYAQPGNDPYGSLDYTNGAGGMEA